MARSLTSTIASALLAAGLLALPGCDFIRGYAEGRSARMLEFERQGLGSEALGAARFAFDDFGSLNTDTLETNALPWKLATTALVLPRDPRAAPSAADVRKVLTGFGFIYPQGIENWPLSAQPAFDRPLGLVTGTISRNLPRIRLEAANTGCAACHAGVTYDATGRPTSRVWIGMPNTSLDIDAFVEAVYRSLKSVRSQRERLLEALMQLYPETTEAELDTIRRFVWPRVNERIAELEAMGDRPLPFRNGGPGVTNGVAALKLHLGVADTNPAFAGTTSIPDLGYRALRSSLLYDGVYAGKRTEPFAMQDTRISQQPEQLAAIVGFFTVPTMGLEPQRAIEAMPRVTEAMRFLQDYRPPRFPGTIDYDRSAQGRIVYDAHCAACHGTYGNDPRQPELVSFPNRLVAQAEMNTDPTRWQAIDAGLLTAIEDSPMAAYLEARSRGGYVAPVLSGLWATAPYLHNGSVPTLWHLMHPQLRPAKFRVGGHALDFGLVGIAGELDSAGTWSYAADYEPWSDPTVFDTAAPGRSNAGHEREFASLSEEEKRSLLEFLKLL